MKNYNALKTKIAAVNPASTAINAYTPTNTPAACPVVNAAWNAHSALPPTPDSGLCACMLKSLSCVPAPNLDPKKYGDVFGYICGQNPANCAGIMANTTTGVFGAFSMCSDTEKLGQVLDTYYKAQKSSASACDFGGQATLQKADVQAACSGSLASASSANGFAATATAGAGATGKNAAGRMQMDRALGFGDFAVGLYVVVAMFVGGGMLML